MKTKKNYSLKVSRSQSNWLVTFFIVFLACVLMTFEGVTKPVAGWLGLEPGTVRDIAVGGALVSLSLGMFTMAIAFSAVPVVPVVIASAGVVVAGFFVYEIFLQSPEQSE